MEDKNIIINESKYNFFKFYNINQPLTDLKYFNSDRLVFTKPVTYKIPNNNNLTFNRVFAAITGPKPIVINEELKNIYDVNELLNYDDSQNEKEFAAKYDFSKLEDADYHVLVDYGWYQSNIDSNLQEPSFVYNIIDTLYHDEPKHKNFIMDKFTVFNATELFKKKPSLINKIPAGHYHVLLTRRWLKDNLSEKYLKAMKEYKPLVFPSEEVFTFGVSQNTLDTNSTSYQISLCLYDRETPKDEEIKWAAKYDELATVCREYLKKTEFKKLKGHIDTMKGLSWKGNEVGDADGPKLYPKIMFNQKKEEFITVFIDETDDVIEDPNTILDKRGRVKVALRFESIFIGSKVALQVKVNDVLISNWIEAFKPKALIVRKNKPSLHKNNKSGKSLSPNKNEEESDLNSSEEEEEEEQELKPSKRIIKTVKMNV